MFAGVKFTSILLVFSLIVLDYSSAFPRARSSSTEEWLGKRVRGEQDANEFGNRRPLWFVQNMQSNRKQQDNDQAQVNNWQMPQGRSVTDRNSIQMEDQPSVYDPTDEMEPYSIVWLEEVSPPVPYPINFVSNVEIPFVNIQDQNTDGSESFGIPSDSDDNIGVNGENIPEVPNNVITFSPFKQISWDKIPTEAQWAYPALSWPISQYSHVPHEYDNPQSNPTVLYDGRPQHGQISSKMPNVDFSWFSPRHEMIPGRRHIDAQFKPRGSKYIQTQPWHKGGQFMPSFVDWPRDLMRPLLGSYPATSPVPHGFPSFTYHKPVTATTNYIMGNVMQVGHNNYSSSFPLQYSIGQSAPDAMLDDLTDLADVENEEFSFKSQTHIRLAELDWENGH